MAGQPVAQVRLPGVFNAWFAAEGIDAVFLPLELPSDRLDVLAGLLRHADNVAGLALTLPHKQAICTRVDRPSGIVAALGAANALRIDPGGEIAADMFDGTGFAAAVTAGGHALAGRTLLVAGCGAAGSAAAWAGLERGAHRVFLRDREPQRAARLAALLNQAASLNEGFAGERARAVGIGETPEAIDVFLNATPLGMRPDDPAPVDLTRLPGHAVVVDAVTFPDGAESKTPLLEAAERRGHPTVPGSAMAAAQAPAFARFFGLDALGDIESLSASSSQ